MQSCMYVYKCVCMYINVYIKGIVISVAFPLQPNYILLIIIIFKKMMKIQIKKLKNINPSTLCIYNCKKQCPIFIHINLFGLGFFQSCNEVNILNTSNKN